ncbi:penicillin-binding protein activator LpoB [Chitinimonas sp. BJYL2]|uniref:penicillin-binding protein activator LpoB n=1 Tax=Chitinimonas sp. BJYL2 TaxID=2976696 RepID=UPI0022B2E94A|nr:penicillin-binding protein activator LpoB [Chitinimonas sp. BJYL2]
MTSLLYRLLPLLAAVLLSACAAVRTAPAPDWQAEARWGLLPVANHSDTPLAGLAAESIVHALLQADGPRSVLRYPPELNGDALFEAADRKTEQTALAWAKQAGVRYAVTGAVSEWRYKVGVDGEPAVGISLSIIDVESGQTVWSGVAADTGWSRSSLTVTAQDAIAKLLRSAKLPR